MAMNITRSDVLDFLIKSNRDKASPTLVNLVVLLVDLFLVLGVLVLFLMLICLIILGALKLMYLFLMFCSAEPFPRGVTKKSGRGRAMDARQRNLEPGRNADEKKFGLGHGEERGEGGGHNEK
ncbi:uncharacterized protein RAG0_08965 [Rhynchosporium agropyri]|uniref:Uncharacterized protein n=1 Tax=Rhynchosporium agropyri TaxID=914238 RepID=A0A1E1KT54_9HELO|nr:uncharacterized protein RAG0_08965 [Rhynchosporium agropyri]